jgi:hypothetical protein
MTAPSLIIAELKSELGESLGTISVLPKLFKTGSRGYFTSQKIEISGKRYQLQVQLVEIGSKSRPEAGDE